MPRNAKTADGAANERKATRSSKKAAAMAEEPTNDADAIAKRAYEIYQMRGGSHGADLDDWLEAERQLKRGATSVTGPAPPPRRRRKVAEGTET
jgi:hypothetical protein